MGRPFPARSMPRVPNPKMRVAADPQLAAITGAAALMAEPLQAEQEAGGPRALAARTIQHGLKLLVDGADLLEAGEPSERVLELLELRLVELADHLCPPAMTELERRWRHVFPGRELVAPAQMVRELRAWVREAYPELVGQARGGG